MMREIHARLPYPSSVELEWLFKIGVPADAMAEPWPIKSTRVRFFNGGTFDFDREAEPLHHGAALRSASATPNTSSILHRGLPTLRSAFIGRRLIG